MNDSSPVALTEPQWRTLNVVVPEATPPIALSVARPPWLEYLDHSCAPFQQLLAIADMFWTMSGPTHSSSHILDTVVRPHLQ
jgi:hypothetical protein